MLGVEERVARDSIVRAWQLAFDEAPVSIGWSANGKWLAAALANGEVHLIDAVAGHAVQKWDAHTFGATAVAWHPWDDLFVSAGQDGTAKLWRAESEEPIVILDCGVGWVEHVAWASSGKQLSTACGKQLSLWSKSGELIRRFAAQPNTIAGMAWSSDSQRLVTACYGQVVFWSPSDSAPKRTFHWKGSMVSMALSPDGKYLCHGNQDSTVHFWIVATGSELQMTGYPMKIGQLSWDRNSKFLATGGSPQITVWDCSGKGPKGRTPLTLMHHLSPLRALAFQSDGPYLASGCARGDVAVWLVGKSKSPLCVSTLLSTITALAWAPGKKQLAASAENGSLVVFNVQ